MKQFIYTFPLICTINLSSVVLLLYSNHLAGASFPFSVKSYIYDCVEIDMRASKCVHDYKEQEMLQISNNY